MTTEYSDFSKERFDALVRICREGSGGRDSYWHGERHWRAVASQAIWLADERQLGTEGAVFGLIFGLLHDSRRISDMADPDHGLRAAWLLERPEFIGLFSLSQRTLMHDALVNHDKGGLAQNELAAICWDADRSTLRRVGIEPDRKYFSRMSDRQYDELLDRADLLDFEQPSWDDLYASLPCVSGCSPRLP